LEYRSPGGWAIDENTDFKIWLQKGSPFSYCHTYKNIHVEIYYMPKLNYEKKLKTKALVDQAYQLVLIQC